MTASSKPLQETLWSDPKFDVVIRSVTLTDQPATIRTDLEIAGRSFHSEISYASIPSWQALWDKCGAGIAPEILGALVAWDSMRFLALGGERLILCDGLRMSPSTQAFWRHCFINQLGEWRCRNNLRYRSADLPMVVCQDDSGLQNAPVAVNSSRNPAEERWLLANGGGKDTLAGMLLLNDLKARYDVFEGYLPIGGTWDLQEKLLERLRVAAAPAETGVIAVRIKDNFFSLSDEQFQKMGVRAQHYKTDFAVGHTANYPGYFPIILHHGYTRIWFNIEASADRGMTVWNGESVNHQWCKSIEYQSGSAALFRELTGRSDFQGFHSTLRGLSDLHIYAIAVTASDLLRKTHSCNYGKPWCRRCPKCCFCYLMMTAMKDEAFALAVVGGTRSLFEMPENEEHWRDLFEEQRVAWECVPSHEECLIAVKRCLDRGVRHEILDRYSAAAIDGSAEFERRYGTVDWSKIPEELHDVITARLGASPVSMAA